VLDFLKDQGPNCTFMFSFVSFNLTKNPDLKEMLLLGRAYFDKFRGLHFNFDDKKVALIPINDSSI